jgi:hypothetical protein
VDRQAIDEVFHPQRPVADPSHLIGRDYELELTVDRLSAVGGHVLLFGHRGIGKTSIAQVTETILRKRYDSLYVRTMICDTRTDFSRIASRCLRGLPQAEDRRLVANPGEVAEVLVDRHGFLILDELDRLPADERTLLADLLKHLSELSSAFNVCGVGIAETASDLFAGHPSVSRCLSEIHVPRLPERKIAEIVEIGFIKLHQRVRVDVVEDIARLSLGFPSNAVLLCRHIADGALKLPTTLVGPDELRRGLERLLADKGVNTAAILAYFDNDPHGQVKRQIVLAAAYLHKENFTTQELFLAVRDRCSIERRSFESFWVALCMDGPEHVFDIVNGPVIRFRDPRLPLMIAATEVWERLKPSTRDGE